MPEENSSFSSIQQALLIPAFEAIVALLKGECKENCVNLSSCIPENQGGKSLT